jgi:hypothetical protein
MNTELLYITAAVMIFLLITFIIRISMNIFRLKKNADKQYQILVDTKDGVVRIDNGKLANELEKVTKELQKKKSIANQSGARLEMLLNKSISNLNRFIKENPHGEESLCKLELRNNIIDTAMNDKFDPDYNTVLEWENHEVETDSNNAKKLEYLIKNLDVAIVMLRSEVCDNGRLDVLKLHEILSLMNQALDSVGYEENVHSTANPIFTYKPVTAHRAIFMENAYNVEPFTSDSMETQVRHQSKFASDHTFEGSVIQDILGYKPPGHIISQMSDETREANYTTRVSACGGRTVSDEDFLSECVGEDLKLRRAIDGDATEMLNCVGKSCYDEKNYYEFYDKLYNQSNRGSNTDYYAML